MAKRDPLENIEHRTSNVEMMRDHASGSVIQAAEISLGAGERGQYFEAAGFQLAPRDEGEGIDLQVLQGAAAGMGPEHFLEELDFLEDRALAEFFRFDPVDEKGKVFRHNQRHHPDMARVLAVALVQAEKAMAFAQEEIDRINDLDISVVDDALKQTGIIPKGNAVNRGHQINDTRWIILKSEDAELAVRRRCAFSELTSRTQFDAFPCGVADPNVTVLRGERPQHVQRSSRVCGINVFRPIIDGLATFNEVDVTGFA